MMDEYLLNTQTPADVDYTSQESQETKLPWGKLISTKDSLESVDLIESCYSLGRESTCHISFFGNKKYKPLDCISKNHLILTKENQIVYLTDLSKNGTFINGKRLDRGCKFILADEDAISLGVPHPRAYIFQSNISPVASLPKQLKDTYFVTEILGRGACGEVSLAYNRRTLRPFALKSIVKARSSASLDRINHPNKIYEEIKILKTINHPFVITIHDMEDTDSHVYIFLEYMKGGELTNRIDSITPLTEGQIKFLTHQIASGVQYLHKRGITHRDLKPQNILLSNDSPFPHLKIADFGLSKILDDVNSMHTMCGSYPYLAPEIIQPVPYNQLVDVWSLGVILYYMFCKKLPFNGANRVQLFQNIKRGIVLFDDHPWRNISVKSKNFSRDLIQKMLIVNPSRRLTIDGVLSHPWLSKDLKLQFKIEGLLRDSDSSTDTNSSDDYLPVIKRSRLQLSDEDIFDSSSTSSLT